MFRGPFDESILRRAQDKGIVDIKIHNLRDWASDKHKTVDDRPFGGGKGMVIRVDVVHRAISNFQFPISNKKKRRIILLSPQGKNFTQKKARDLSKLEHLILIAGHYEGFDERITENLVDEEISIGDYILTGGEIPVMVIVDSVARLLPGVLEEETTKHESFSKLKIENSKLKNLLDYPQYTRPEKYLDWKVPKVLLSGNHKEIEKWRQNKSVEISKQKRPDLIKD
ncbi:tRNA (guanosine(37)-N1)-methyltransferase TrmD [Candidatus Woesebacteria bacterium RBG_13_34_9]|uniref:tRNA (guanine-N(1)-)-methyltransferase n=1 Tax=Candidatus Woesebacteria bacterium RBG_13_34_9 TaxID=1802477 RepID=A0A1F7X6R0_9BACT|nr:MAG: tRNA (guanosine(37)-N1)-methyltransferase TrmD [Candidatus Woesebacteria bacterium RBG_13_34_9]